MDLVLQFLLSLQLASITRERGETPFLYFSVLFFSLLAFHPSLHHRQLNQFCNWFSLPSFPFHPAAHFRNFPWFSFLLLPCEKSPNENNLLVHCRFYILVWTTLHSFRSPQALQLLLSNHTSLSLDKQRPQVLVSSEQQTLGPVLTNPAFLLLSFSPTLSQQTNVCSHLSWQGHSSVSCS